LRSIACACGHLHLAHAVLFNAETLLVCLRHTITLLVGSCVLRRNTPAWYARRLVGSTTLPPDQTLSPGGKFGAPIVSLPARVIVPAHPVDSPIPQLSGIRYEVVAQASLHRPDRLDLTCAGGAPTLFQQDSAVSHRCGSLFLPTHRRLADP
jgi:hypothetical protein